MAAQKVASTATTPVLWVDGSAETGLHLFCRYPIFDSNKNLIGSLLAGQAIANQDSVEYIKSTSSLDATIFAGNKRIATTIMKNDVNQVGTTLTAPLPPPFSIRDRNTTAGPRFWVNLHGRLCTGLQLRSSSGRGFIFRQVHAVHLYHPQPCHHLDFTFLGLKRFF